MIFSYIKILAEIGILGNKVYYFLWVLYNKEVWFIVK